MAESERLVVPQPHQNNEPKQVSTDHVDVIFDRDGDESDAVVVDNDSGGGEEEDGENDKDETQPELRRLTPEEDSAEPLSSMQHEKPGNLDVTASALVSENDQCIGSLGNSALETRTEAGFEEQVGLSQKEVAVCISPKNAKAESDNQLQLWVFPAPLSGLSPTSVSQPISSVPDPTVPEQRFPLSKGSTLTVQEANQQMPSYIKKLTMPVLKTPIPDGYNWRKYGQKQVKSPNGSRSYYRCTHSDCCAKKIECSDQSGHVIEIVNKGLHSHDLPQKSNSKRESRVATSGRPIPSSIIAEHSVVPQESDPVLSEQPKQQKTIVADGNRLDSFASDENNAAQTNEEHICEPETTKRLKKDSLDCPEALFKPGKKSKFVVHAAGDVGISGDGYRWRKYGQKMVKGNAHPRNYYRCTSAGCPVRKHIETEAGNSSVVIITYKGIHDHDMPVPKKRHGPPSASLVAAAAAAGSTNAVQQQKSSMKWPARKEGEITSETTPDARGGDKDKVIESARTLLSIGFEIKPF